jgi:diguanylate cyclase
MSKFSLRQQLVLPFVFLVIFVSLTIGWLSYHAGEEAVNNLAHRVLLDIVQRINTATEQHLIGALTTLNSIAPDPSTLPREQAFSDDLDALENQLWVASGLFLKVSNYVYFGGADGRFIGINRVSKDFVELYRRDPGDKQRSVYSVMAAGDRSILLRTDNYDPRIRPWYEVAAKQKQPAWSPVYNDFTSREPTVTLAKAVQRADHTLAGVVATDVTLKVLSDFLRSLTVTKNGVAFVIDGNGVMIATSGQQLPFKMNDDKPVRIRAADMSTQFISQASAKILEWKNSNVKPDRPLTLTMQTDTGPVEVMAALLGNQYGLDWITAVVVPRSDFMSGVTRSFYNSMTIGALCVLAALAIGMTILNRVLRDVRILTNAVKKIGNGELVPTVQIRRKDEIGLLAQTFNEMEHNLRIDNLTDIFNRDFLCARIRFLQHQAQVTQPQAVQPNFALLFIDVDHFKTINDQYGHDVGDHILITVATRLKSATRATDIVARFGGDEFVVLLNEVNSPALASAAEEKIRAVVEAPMTLEHKQIDIRISIGWALFPQEAQDTEKLFKIADQRMFEAKKQRKARQDDEQPIRHNRHHWAS